MLTIDTPTPATPSLSDRPMRLPSSILVALTFGFTTLFLPGQGNAQTSAARPGWERVVDAPGLSSVEREGAQFLAQHLDISTWDLLPLRHQRTLLRYAADHRDGHPSHVLCWESHTPRVVVSAFHAVEEASAQAKRIARRKIGIGTAFQADESDHWARTATNGTNQGAQGNPVTLTWSIVPDGTTIPGGEVSGEGTNEPSNLRAWLAGIYGGSATGPASTQVWFPVLQAAFDNIAAKTGMRYVYEPNDDGATLSSLSSGQGSLGVRGDVRISGHAIDGNSNVLAYNYFPDYSDMVIDTADGFFNTTSNNSLRLRNVVEHEHGHGLGLKHVCPVDNTKLMEPFINLGFTGFQFDEIYTTQRLYGDFLEVHGSERDNDTLAKATPVIAPVNVPFVAQWAGIDDNSDVDFYRFSVPAGTQLTARVIPSTAAYLEGAQNQVTGACTAGTSFNSAILHDLAFAILAPDQTTVLGTGNTQPAGTAEVVADLPIAVAGTHYLQVTGGAANFNQLYRLEIEVGAPSVAMQLVSATVTTELFQGVNGAPDPGETVELEVVLENVGLIGATNLEATLVLPAGFPGFDTAHHYGSVGSGSTGAGSFVFASSGPCGGPFTLQLQLAADGGYAATIPVDLALGVELATFEEDFDGGAGIPAGWGNAETGKGSLWSIVSAASNSAPNSAFAENKSQAGQSILTTPAISVGAVPGKLGFSHFYDTETNWDGGVLEILIGAGSWQDILDAGGAFDSGGYNLALAGINNPLAGRSGWSGNSGGFITTVVTLPPSAANENVQFRWILGHDNRIGANGWFVDDVSFKEFACDAGGVLLTLSSADDSASEYFNATDTAEVSVSAALPVPTNIPVTLSAAGTASPALDVTGFGNLTLAAGNASATATLSAVSDGLVEGNETLEVSSPDATGTVQVTIADTPYGQWAASELSTTGAVNPFDDFDLDGSLNVEELIFGTDGASPASFENLEFIPVGPDRKIAVPLGALPADILVEGATSLDLTTWTHDGVTDLADGFSISGDDALRFFRLIYTVRRTAP